MNILTATVSNFLPGGRIQLVTRCPRTLRIYLRSGMPAILRRSTGSRRLFMRNYVTKPPGIYGALGHTLQTTALIAANLMRQVAHARRRDADKRGGSQVRVPLDEAFGMVNEIDVDLLAIDQALGKLETLDPQAGAGGRTTVFKWLDC